jgi:predicted enzyme related to lactoylglutathione lyase
MPKVNWVEIPAEDLDRARMFYSQLFGWKIEELSLARRRDYFLIKTGPEGTIYGGLIRRKHPKQTTVN